MRPSRHLPASIALCLLSALLAAPRTARAQTAAAAEPPLTVQAELSYVATSGNTDTQTLGVGGEFQIDTDGWTIDAKSAYVSGSSQDQLTARSVTTQARVARRISEYFELFGRFDHVRNRFAGIRNRFATEGGIGYRIGENDATHRLRIVAALGFTQELRVATPDRAFASANYGARYRWRLSATAEVAAEGNVTQNLETSSDWRAATTTSVTAQLTSALSLKLSNRVAYLYQPVPGFGKSDVLTSAAVVAAF